MKAMPLRREWLEELTLAKRRPPEFYLWHDNFADGPHAATLRVAFQDLGLSAVFCVEHVPTIGFLVLDKERLDTVDEVHRALWNQGQMTMLVVICGDVLRAYSLTRLPRRSEPGQDTDPRLVATFERLRDALELKELVLGVESGRWWDKHAEAFGPSERVDQILLGNLMTASKELRATNLSPEAAQALLMQTMFIAYLEDREVILASYFHEATGARADSLAELLATRKASLLDALFDRLRRDFNGDVFLAPCAFEPIKSLPVVRSEHFEILERFHGGREIMETRQQRFWGYDFKYIPVVLLSAVYDRFLGENPDSRRKEGAYYTPMFLVDTVVSQVWDSLTEQQRLKTLAIDPACGSGIFLVRLFQRLVEHQRARSQKAVAWESLVAIVKRLHGMDINASALRVAAFSLYIALLEQVTPPDIRALMKRGEMLPRLWGQTLRNQSFFGQSPESGYDVVIGNPPWTSRHGDTGGAQLWCAENDLPCPSDEAAWGFIWKAGLLLTTNGIAGLLLPAMGVLHNHADESVRARRKLLQEYRVERIVNFSDLSFQLFDGANRPATLVLYRQWTRSAGAYRFEYWCPKADLNLRLKRVLTLSRADRTCLRSDFAAKEPQLFKRRLWMRRPDEKLLLFLASLPCLGDLVKEHEAVRRSTESHAGWVIGQGFKPTTRERLDDPQYSTKISEAVTRYPFLKTGAFQAVALPIVHDKPWPISRVHRIGFFDGFPGPHILIPQGVQRKVGRVRAAYTEQALAFRHSIQAIKFPSRERPRAKLLTAILNSRLTAWFVFHETANLGTDRAKVHQSELLSIPFPSPNDLPDPKAAKVVADRIVRLVDNAVASADKLLTTERSLLQEIDTLVFEYFGLSDDEIAVVEDTLDYLIPAMQPRANSFPSLWRACKKYDRASYASTLARAIKSWLADGTHIEVHLAGIGSDVAVIRLCLVPGKQASRKYQETGAADITSVLNRIWDVLPVTLPGNFQIIPDLRVFLGGDLYMVKPRQLRYWLRSSALDDADEVVADLHRASRNTLREAPVVHADR